MTELQQALFTYLLAVGYIPEEVAKDSDPAELLASAVDVITEQAYDGCGDPAPLLAIARACDIACFGTTEDLAKRWARGELENTEEEKRLLERVRLTMDRRSSGSFEPIAQAAAVIELLGSREPWVARLIEQAGGGR